MSTSGSAFPVDLDAQAEHISVTDVDQDGMREHVSAYEALDALAGEWRVESNCLELDHKAGREQIRHLRDEG